MNALTIPYSQSKEAISPFCHLLDVILRDGGYVVAFIEAYFDESGSDDGSPILCVAGYILEKSAAANMDSDWLAVLNKFNIPYFRMSSCAHGTVPFSALTKEERIEAEKQMIAIIKNYASFGIVVTVDTNAFSRVMPKLPEIGSPYSLCAHTCLTAVKSWANEQRFTGSIAYIFESGHRSQSEANGIMNRLFRIPQMRADHRYGSHTFADKAKIRPLQAADLLAWQWYTDRKRSPTFGRPRLDLQELVKNEKPPHYVMHFDEPELRMLANVGLRGQYPLTYPYK